jgi:hypothetical protein
MQFNWLRALNMHRKTLISLVYKLTFDAPDWET